MNEFQFTNTLSPITNLSYHSCGNKQDGEDRLRAYFASNINKISGIGFKLDYLYGRGYYNNQATSLFNGSLYGYYLDDRYNMHAWISVNHMRMGENGGIENDDYITHPEDFTRSYGSRDIPTILSENWNRNEDQTYYLTHLLTVPAQTFPYGAAPCFSPHIPFCPVPAVPGWRTFSSAPQGVHAPTRRRREKYIRVP